MFLQASLAASDRDIDLLATCYWFTVEFGVLKEEGKHKVSLSIYLSPCPGHTQFLCFRSFVFLFSFLHPHTQYEFRMHYSDYAQAYGAGLLSSFGEMVRHVWQKQGTHVNWDCKLRGVTLSALLPLFCVFLHCRNGPAPTIPLRNAGE